MPKFKLMFRREWVEYDTFEREIEAATIEEANEIADEMAADPNSDCPDDVVTTKDGHANEWECYDIEKETQK